MGVNPLKQKSACKIKTVLFAIVFAASLYFFNFVVRCILDTYDIWFAVMEIPILFALCNSSTKMFKNAFAAGWIEFQEENKDA